MARKYSVEQLRIAVSESTNRRQVLERLGLRPAGGNYAALKKLIRDLELDISHFQGSAWSQGKSLPPRREIGDYLKENSSVSSHTLRLRLIREGLFEAKCYGCEQATWLGQPIPLELEHKNGLHNDNRLENLTLLCPNCHALTPTYRSRNRTPKAKVAVREAAERQTEARLANRCQVCGTACLAKFCSPGCVHLSQRKAARPTRDELAELVKINSILAIGRRYGVSDNAVRKWLKAYQLR